MVTINIRDVAGFGDTADQGRIAYDFISRALDSDGSVIISFEGVPTVTSSFVNVAFVDLLRRHSFATIKDRVRVISASRQIAEMIRTRLTKAASVQHAA